jgi:hypothetical protein
MNDNLKKIFNYALQQMKAQLADYQRQIILKNAFLHEAILHEDGQFFYASDPERTKFLSRDLKKNYDELMELTKQLETLIRTVKDAEDEVFYDNLKDYFKSQTK